METTHDIEKNRRKRSARKRLLIALAASLLVTVLISFRDDNFLWNLAYYWLPQLGVLGILRTLKLKTSALVGTVYAMALHLAMYEILVLILQVPNTMVWSWYFFSLPGSVTGASIGFTIISRKRPGSRKIVYLTGVGTFIGAVLAQALALIIVMTDTSRSRNDQNRTPARNRRAGHDEIRRYEQMDIALANLEVMNGGAAGLAQGPGARDSLYANARFIPSTTITNPIANTDATIAQYRTGLSLRVTAV